MVLGRTVFTLGPVLFPNLAVVERVMEYHLLFTQTAGPTHSAVTYTTTISYFAPLLQDTS